MNNQDFQRQLAEKEAARDKAKSESDTTIRRATIAQRNGTATPDQVQVIENAEEVEEKRYQDHLRDMSSDADTKILTNFG